MKDISSVNLVKLAKLNGDYDKMDQPHGMTDEERCPLCRFTNTIDTPGDIFVMPAPDPAAEVHLWAAPKSHHNPASVLDLTANDVPLVQELKQACVEFFERNGIDVSQAIYGFQIPNLGPIGHLHMECIVPPISHAKKQVL